MESSRDPREWAKFRVMAQAFPEEAERGRLVAAHEIATNPGARKRVEDAVGIETAKRMYPEAYRYTGTFSGVVRWLDKCRGAIPW